MLEFNQDLFFLFIAFKFHLTLKDSKIHIENLYQRLFIKNEKFEINEDWFMYLDFYVKHREVLLNNSKTKHFIKYD